MKLTFAQHCALVAASEAHAVTAKSIGASVATMKALETKGLLRNDGPNIKGRVVWRITDAGRKAFEGKT